MIKLKYGNTNTFFIDGLLVDTDYAGTKSAFFRSLKENGIRVTDIRFVLATHYHPDHAGLIGELQSMGVRPVIIDVQTETVHYPDAIFERDGLDFFPVDEKAASVISCGESREFLAEIGISGEIIHTPSHSVDSVSLILDDGDCIVGDLEPYEYVEAYGDGSALRRDWDRILSYRPRRVFFSHAPERILK